MSSLSLTPRVLITGNLSNMVFKLALATVAFAALAGAANYKRVTCPDGNVASHSAVSNFVSCIAYFILTPASLVLRVLRSPR